MRGCRSRRGPLLAAQAEAANCYYKCQLPLWLRSFFGVKEVSSQLAGQMGLFRFDLWEEFPDDGEGVLSLTVSPMGWSWAFWVI